MTWCHTWFIWEQHPPQTSVRPRWKRIISRVSHISSRFSSWPCLQVFTECPGTDNQRRVFSLKAIYLCSIVLCKELSCDIILDALIVLLSPKVINRSLKAIEPGGQHARAPPTQRREWSPRGRRRIPSPFPQGLSQWEAVDSFPFPPWKHPGPSLAGIRTWLCQGCRPRLAILLTPKKPILLQESLTVCSF